MKACTLSSLLERGDIWPADPEGQFVHSNPAHLKIILLNAKQTPAHKSVSCGLENIDSLLPHQGLRAGSLNEYFVNNPSPGLQAKNFFPLHFPAVIAINALKQNRSKLAVWIGKDSWPTTHTLRMLLKSRQLNIEEALTHCLFLNPAGEKLTLWALEAVLRSPAVCAVTASLKKMSNIFSRRLALAAEKSGALALLFRPLSSLNLSSFAATRWLISPVPSSNLNPCYDLSLLKCKGQKFSEKNWTVEWCLNELDNTAHLSLHLSAKLGDSVAGEEASCRRGRTKAAASA
jgi:hypothetical protein